jgi:hypothetical protein
MRRWKLSRIHTYHAVPMPFREAFRLSFPFNLHGAALFGSHIPCRSAKRLDCLSHLIYTVRPCLVHTYHAVPMPFREAFRLSFPFDLHGAALFVSHILCRSHAVPLPCHEHAALKATAQSHGMVAAVKRHGNGMVCVNPPLTDKCGTGIQGQV